MQLSGPTALSLKERARSKPWLIGAATLPFLAVAASYAFFLIFTRKHGDDEGYLMISLQGFLEGYPLYDAVFSHYGPFYYLYQSLLRGVLHLPLTHDVTRLLCVIHWTATAMVLGVAGGLMMRSVLAGLLVFMQATVHLTLISNEPGHPQEVVALLLALAVLAVVKAGARQAVPWAVLGIVTAALAFTKINVGVYFGATVLLAMRWHANDRFAKPPWNWIVVAICAVLPFWLARHYFAEPWCRNYAIVSASTIVISLGVAPFFARRAVLPFQAYLKVSRFFLAPALVMVVVILWHGTSLNGLWEGLLLKPLKLSTLAVLRMPFPNSTLANAAASAIIASLFVWQTRRTDTIALLALIKGVYGLIGALWLVGEVNLQLSYLLPWVWLVLVPAKSDRENGATFPRVFLCLAAAWQSLQAYPIAGTQVALATLLLVLVYTVCLHDAFTSVRLPGRVQERFKAALTPDLGLVKILAGVLLLYLFAMVWCQPHQLRREYASFTPLGLPGTKYIRLDAASVELHQELMTYLRAECDTFITYPGFNSFYFWTNKRPPTYLNSTGWGAFSEAQQEEILAALRRARRPLIVVHENILRGWMHQVPAPIRPLGRAVLEESRFVKQIGPFVIWSPAGDRE